MALVPQDPFAQMGALALKLKEADDGIRIAQETVRRLSAERDEVRSAMRALAPKLQSDASGLRPVIPDESESGLPKRKLELLRLLRNTPGEPASHYAKVMYNDEDSAPNVSSYFSQLNSDGYVEATKRGRYKLTSKGLAAIGG